MHSCILTTTYKNAHNILSSINEEYSFSVSKHCAESTHIEKSPNNHTENSQYHTWLRERWTVDDYCVRFAILKFLYANAKSIYCFDFRWYLYISGNCDIEDNDLWHGNDVWSTSMRAALWQRSFLCKFSHFGITESLVTSFASEATTQCLSRVATFRNSHFDLSQDTAYPG
jgi:hypothetical protein